MRKGCDGLAALVSAQMELEPCSTQLFVFHNRSRDKIKALLWEKNGFRTFYKKLIKQRFHLPDWFEGNNLVLNHEQCALLLQGFNLNGMRPHHRINLQFHL